MLLCDPRHGSRAGYNLGCRRHVCPYPYPYDCTTAASRQAKQSVHARAHGIGNLIDATGSRRRVQALQVLGWTLPQIAARCGWKTGQNVTYAIRNTRVTRTTAARISDAYEYLSARPGPSAETRRRAARNGWSAPFAWDNIDNPAEQPWKPGKQQPRSGVDEALVLRVLDGERMPGATRAERVECARRWQAAGGSLGELVRLQGWPLWRDLKAA